MKIATDFYAFKRNSTYWRVSILFRVTHDNGAHADLEVRGTADGTSILTALIAFYRAKQSQRESIEQWRKQNV